VLIDDGISYTSGDPNEVLSIYEGRLENTAFWDREKLDNFRENT